MDLYLLTTILCSLLLFLYLAYRPPHPLIQYLQKKYPDVLFYRTTSRKIIALTIDDAPSQYTPNILTILAKYNAKATFFCIGNQISAEGGEQMLKDIVSAGHELGNHAMRDEPSFRLAREDLSRQIIQVDRMIRLVYESLALLPPPRYFRPGSGIFTNGMREIVKELGYRLILGNIYPHDPFVPFPKVNGGYVASMVSPGGIVILHDRRQWSEATLDIALRKVKEKGYTIGTISELVETTGGWNRS